MWHKYVRSFALTAASHANKKHSERIEGGVALQVGGGGGGGQKNSELPQDHTFRMETKHLLTASAKHTVATKKGN